MLRIRLARRVLLACLSGTRPKAHWRLFAGLEQARSDRAPPATRVLLAGCRTGRHWTLSSYQACRTPRYPGLCDAGFTSMPAGSISPRLYPTTRLRRFSLLFYGFYDRDHELILEVSAATEVVGSLRKRWDHQYPAYSEIFSSG